MSAEKPRQGTPSSHPSSEGLGHAIKAGVQEELERLGIGGGGGGGDRLSALEKEVAVIKETMVKKEDLQKELGDLRVRIGEIPLAVVKWFGAVLAIISVVGAGIFAILKVALAH